MTFQGLIKYPAAFVIAICVTLILVPLVRKTALFFKVVDNPGARRLNKATVPRAGGLAVFAGFHAACAFVFLFPWATPFSGQLTLSWWLSFLAASSILLIIGLFDDAFNLSWPTKLAGQAFASVYMVSNGLGIHQFQGYDLPILIDILATMLWLMALTNAFNLIDGLDGLAAGLAAIAVLGLAGSSLFRNLPSDALVSLALFGACLGFLRYNFNPASIFLGDSGSMFLGFAIASISLSTSTKSTTVAALGVPLLAVGVPVFDTILAIWRRSIRAILGKSKDNQSKMSGIMHADMDHLHHRLVKSGFSQKRTALWLYGINGFLVLVGLLSLICNSRASGIFIMAFVVGSFVIVKHLARVELWDSGNAILQGIRKPSRSLLISASWPLFDAVFMALSLAIAVALCHPDPEALSFKQEWFYSIPIWCGIPFICVFLSGSYSRVWSRARISEFLLLISSVVAGVALSAGLSLVLNNKEPLQPIAILAVLHTAFSGAFVLSLRVIPRSALDLMSLFDQASVYNKPGTWNILVYGAGFRGILYLKHRAFCSSRTASTARIIGFLDDDRLLRKRIVHGYPVLGTLVEIPEILVTQKVDEIVLASDIPPHTRLRLVQYCSSKGIKLTEWMMEERAIDTRGNNTATNSRIKTLRL